MSNAAIRQAILHYINQNGPQDTRYVIRRFAHMLGVTKQRISGNISCMACVEGTVSIIPNRPHSIMM